MNTIIPYLLSLLSGFIVGAVTVARIFKLELHDKIDALETSLHTRFAAVETAIEAKFKRLAPPATPANLPTTTGTPPPAPTPSITSVAGTQPGG